MERKRGLFAIVASMLEVLESGACGKTTVASKANLSTRSANKYINFVIKVNLVVRDESANFLKTTEKGRKFLEEYRKLKLLVEE